MRVVGYLSRWDFILCHCIGRRVLNRGCDGETALSREVRVEAIHSSALTVFKGLRWPPWRQQRAGSLQ